MIRTVKICDRQWTLEYGDPYSGQMRLREEGMVADLAAWYGPAWYLKERLVKLAKLVTLKGRVGYLANITVLSHRQGLGIGTAILEFALWILKSELSVERVYLHRIADPGKEEKLERFYVRAGFQDAGHLEDGSGIEVMVKELA